MIILLTAKKRKQRGRNLPLDERQPQDVFVLAVHSLIHETRRFHFLACEVAVAPLYNLIAAFGGNGL